MKCDPCVASCGPRGGPLDNTPAAIFLTPFSSRFFCPSRAAICNAWRRFQECNFGQVHAKRRNAYVHPMWGKGGVISCESGWARRSRLALQMFVPTSVRERSWPSNRPTHTRVHTKMVVLAKPLSCRLSSPRDQCKAQTSPWGNGWSYLKPPRAVACWVGHGLRFRRQRVDFFADFRPGASVSIRFSSNMSSRTNPNVGGPHIRVWVARPAGEPPALRRVKPALVQPSGGRLLV